MKQKKNIKKCIKEKGLKIGYVAQQIGYSRQWFNQRLKTPEEFTLKEAVTIANLLGEDIKCLDFGINL